MKKTILFVVPLLIILSIILFQKNSNISKDEKPTKYEKIDINSGENIYTYKDYIYVYGKSGIKIYQNSKEVFSESFSSENIYAVFSDNVIIIGDKNGKTIRVYNEKGNLYSINHTDNIMSCTVNKNGYSAFISKIASSYEILIFNSNGENIFSLTDITYKEGVPINLALSNDNCSLAVSFLKTDGAVIESNIAVYSMSQEDSVNNSMIGAFKKINQVSGIIKFLDYENLLILSEKEFSIISIKEKLKSVNEIVKVNFNNKIDFVSFLNNTGFALSYGEQTITAEENKIPKNTVIIYNSSGGKIEEIKFDNNITNIFTNKIGVIVCQDRLFTGYSNTGKKIFEYQATQDIKSMQFFDSKDKALLVTENEIRILKLNKKNIKLLEENTDSNNANTETTEEVTEETTQEDTSLDNANIETIEETTKEITEETTKNVG